MIEFVDESKLENGADDDSDLYLFTTGRRDNDTDNDVLVNSESSGGTDDDDAVVIVELVTTILIVTFSFSAFPVKTSFPSLIFKKL